MIGVTGSVGKTTCKDIIAKVLEEKHPVLKSKGNYNTEIGLPLTLLDLSPGQHWAVLEMGMHGLGEIAHLCDISKPDIGIITNIGPSHLDRLGSIESIVSAKSELLKSLPQTGISVLRCLAIPSIIGKTDHAVRFNKIAFMQRY